MTTKKLFQINQSHRFCLHHHHHDRHHHHQEHDGFNQFSNGHIPAGGVYYIISRSLGPAIGKKLVIIIFLNIIIITIMMMKMMMMITTTIRWFNRFDVHNCEHDLSWNLYCRLLIILP